MINKTDIIITLDYIDIIKKEYKDIYIVGSFNIIYDKLKEIIKNFDDINDNVEISYNNFLKSVKKVFIYLKNNNKRNKILVESIDMIVNTLEME